jgi:hypothetical protein
VELKVLVLMDKVQADLIQYLIALHLQAVVLVLENIVRLAEEFQARLEDRAAEETQILARGAQVIRQVHHHHKALREELDLVMGEIMARVARVEAQLQ